MCLEGLFVTRDLKFALAGLDSHRRKFPVKTAILVGELATLGRADCECVLLLTGKRIFARTVFGKQTHGLALVSILEAVGHHVIQDLTMPHPQSGPPLRQQVGGIRHALHAARHDDFGRTRKQHIVREHRGFHARTAHLGKCGRAR